MNSKVITGILIAVAQLGPLPAAADTIRPGKWEYTVTTQMPTMPQTPQPPAGVQLPPNLQMPSGGGMRATHTDCVTSTDPAAELSKPRGPAADQSRCSIERVDRGASTVSWATTCTTPDGVSRSQGTARYTGESIEANTRTRTTHQHGMPLEVSNHIVGRYLGPCDGE